jgi:NDP-sugar pyrophosphorylase family protein
MDIAFLCGGKGARLRPLTYAVPKPMLPIGSKPILEINIENAQKLGFNRIFLMVGYKAEIIQSYFGNGESLGVQIKYFEETEQRGTAGPLHALTEDIENPFLVMNADILTDLNLHNLLRYHIEEEADLTVALKRFEINIPYGVASLNEKKMIDIIDEKPTFYFLINSGIYVISKNILSIVPSVGIYPMTKFITDCIEHDKRVIGYEFDNDWRDIGHLDDYMKVAHDNSESSDRLSLL